MSELTKQSLSPPRQRLVELMQKINFGRVERLPVRGGEPVFEPPPRVFREVVFGKVNTPHPAHGKGNFTLKEQLVELFGLFDREPEVLIECLVLQNGLPVRMTLASTL